MILPDYVARCLDALENWGYPAYVVGGCVRDACLGLTPQDFDLCTAALPEQTQAVFSGEKLVLSGVKHGTVGVVTEGGLVEITTFRAEGTYRDSRRPEWVEFISSIDQDLARRDFTINAMAWSPRRGLADPFGGREDLRRRVLRTVGNPEKRFQEDALRILRGARFAVRFGLQVAPETAAAMRAQAPLMDHLARERVFEELCKLLPLVNAGDLARFAPVLTQAIPELAPMVGFDQHSPHHVYDLYTHVAHVVAAVPGELTLRWAALLHDVGKVPTFTRDAAGRGHFYGHAQVGAELADGILRRLKAPAALREQAVTLIANHMTQLEPDARALHRQLGRLGWDTVQMLICLQEADMAGKGTGALQDRGRFSKLRACLAELKAQDACLKVKDLAVNGYDLLALGYSGRQIGQALNALLRQVLDERLPNERQALLNALGRENGGTP